ncbi:MAG: hypothetical protein AAB676_04285 [Verrucomicrobiota bacterium]|mgnify:FL=1
MNTVAEELATPLAPPNLERIVLAQVDQWLGQCHAFRQWYRQSFLLRRPSREQEKLADEIQPWMIRITRALLSQMLDPEFPHRHLARSVEATLWQLEEDWAGRHNPMTEAEADSILHASFPEHAS